MKKSEGEIDDVNVYYKTCYLDAFVVKYILSNYIFGVMVKSKCKFGVKCKSMKLLSAIKEVNL